MRILQCTICGHEFETAACNAKYCPDCRKKAKSKSKPKPIPERTNQSLADVMRELNEYNRKHGTLLTYGKWVSMNEEIRRKKG